MIEVNGIIKDYHEITIGKDRFSTEKLRARLRRLITEAINGEIK